MHPQPLSDARLANIETLIKERSIPYTYDTKEYPIELIVLKYAPQPGEEQTMFIPTYQRALVWDERRQSKFIESLYLGVPIPPVFVAEIDENGNLEIIDGSQRIRTIALYITDKLKLSNLEEIEDLNDTIFSQLIAARQRKFLNIALRFHVITDKADLAIRADIFDRLNSNVKPLTASEIRKGAYSSNGFYQFIIQQSTRPEFEALFSGSGKHDEKQELVLRFFAYAESYQNFKHDVAIFLNRFVERKGAEGFNADLLSQQFLNVLNFVQEYFPNGFKKALNAKSIPRVRFEAIAVGTHLALLHNPQLVPGNLDWLESEEFKNHTTSDASNNRNKLIGRIEFVRDNLLM